jgi:hypothetical protein
VLDLKCKDKIPPQYFGFFANYEVVFIKKMSKHKSKILKTNVLCVFKSQRKKPMA